MTWLLAAAIAVAIALALRGSRRLFSVEVRDGRVVAARGRIPPALLRDIRAIVAEGRVRRGWVVADDGRDRPSLRCSPDVDAAVAQRLRNAFAAYPSAVLWQAPKVASGRS